MEPPNKHRWMRMWHKFFILKSRARLISVLVVQQLLDLFTTWWLVFHAKVGVEINPLLQVINGENGLTWLVGTKVGAAALGASVCWLSLSPQNIKNYFWYLWNGLAYYYTLILLWSTSLVVYASTML